MNITIVGAGNIGTQFAVHCAEKGHTVTVFGSKPELINKHLNIVDENLCEIHSGDINCSTSDCEVAFNNAELIFVTMPAFCMSDVAEKILPYANENMYIGIIPGTGGGECAFKKCADKGSIIFGLQRVPSVARLIEYGKTVKATGYRDELYVASLPSNKASHISKIISDIFDMKCSTMPNYLNLTLTPSNPILHTTRLKTLFSDYKEGVYYDDVPLFYEGWNNETSELLFKCDDEVQALCNKLNQFDLTFVKSLKIHYESKTPEALTNKIRSIKGFKGLTSPVIQTENGFIPDLNSRYFTADFPFGLSILVQIAKFADVYCPNMEATLNWYRSLCKDIREFSFKDFGICNLDELIEYYSK